MTIRRAISGRPVGGERRGGRGGRRSEKEERGREEGE